MPRWKATIFVNSQVGEISTEVESATFDGARQQIYTRHGNVESIRNLVQISDSFDYAQSGERGFNAYSQGLDMESGVGLDDTWKIDYKKGGIDMLQSAGEAFFFKAVYLSDKYINLYINEYLTIPGHDPVPCRELIHKGATELLIDGDCSDVTTSKVRNFIGDSSEEEFFSDLRKYSDFHETKFLANYWGFYFYLAASIVRLLIIIKGSSYSPNGLVAVHKEHGDSLETLLKDYSQIHIGTLVVEGEFLHEEEEDEDEDE